MIRVFCYLNNNQIIQEKEILSVVLYRPHVGSAPTEQSATQLLLVVPDLLWPDSPGSLLKVWALQRQHSAGLTKR